MNTIIKEILFDFIKAYKSSISKERDEAIELAVDKVEALLKAQKEEILEIIRLLKIEYANTPMNKRLNGNEWLRKVETKIKTLTKQK